MGMPSQCRSSAPATIHEKSEIFWCQTHVNKSRNHKAHSGAHDKHSRGYTLHHTTAERLKVSFYCFYGLSNDDAGQRNQQFRRIAHRVQTSLENLANHYG